MTQDVLKQFIAEVKPTQTLWALQDPASEDWVVLDSNEYENIDVLPLWSNESIAKQQCIDEWENYVATPISLSDWFEFWLEDLNEDGACVGVNWQENQPCLEVELSQFSQLLAEIETL